MGLSIGNRLLGSTGLSNGFGLSVGNGLAFLGFGAAFSPAELFANGEPGAWYDPSDLTTLFQDSAGTTPVTAVEQAVGLMLDKSKSGVGTNGAKRVNLLTWTQAFNDAVWLKTNSSITQNAAVAPDGTTTADKLISANGVMLGWSTAQTPVMTTNVGLIPTSSFAVLTVYAKAAEFNQVQVFLSDGALGEFATVSLVDGSVITAPVAAAVSVTSAGNGWYAVSITKQMNSGGNPNGVRFSAYDSVATTGNGTSGIYIWGADLRLASEASTAPTPYQRIDATWYDTMAGNHLTQSTTTARPVLSARYNLLTQTEAFNEAVWVKTNVTVTANAAVAPDGTTTADLIYPTTSGTGRFVNRDTTGQIVGSSFTTRIGIKAAGIGFAYVYNVQGNQLLYVNLTTGATSNVGTNISNLTSSIDANGWVIVSFTSTLTVGTIASYYVGPCDASGSTQVTASGTNGIYIWGADLRVANDGVGLPPYQRVGAATYGSSGTASPPVAGVTGVPDYDTTGFPLYLRFDGTDDFMVSPTITPGIDKVQVFAGVRKLSDAAVGILAEFGNISTPTIGSWLINAPHTAAGTYRFFSYNGSGSGSAIGSSFPAPITNALTGLGDISGDRATLRVNGVQAAQATTDQGTGGYLAYPLYVGARAGTSDRFNGRLYPLIVRFGANLSDTQIAQTESYVSTKMGGGYVPVGYDFLVDANGDQLTDGSGNPLYAQPLYS